jgi:hypothetical protein
VATAATSNASEQIKVIDEKIRSLLMALSFFVAGMLTVFYVTRDASGKFPKLKWDHMSPNAGTVFMVIFGGSVFGAVACALVALDPASYRPMFVPGSEELGRWPIVREAKFKAARFADAQAFVWLVIAAAVLLGISQLPATDAGTKTWLIGLGLMGFLALSVLIPASLWWPERGLRAFISRSGWRTTLSFILVPFAAAALTAAAFWVGRDMKWTAALYLLTWLLFSHLSQHRSRPLLKSLRLADVVAIGWLAVCFVILLLAWIHPYDGIASFDLGSAVSK